MYIKEILNKFDIKGEFVSYCKFGNGHINDTFLASYNKDGYIKKYILQRINSNVFNNVYDVMFNMYNVTSYIRGKLIALGKDAERECLKIIKTKDGKIFLNHYDGSVWRLLKHIPNSYSVDSPKNATMFKKAGEKFGEFINLLDGFNIDDLNIIIPDFHNTKKRYENLIKAINDNFSGRRDMALPEIEFAKQREHKINKINERMEQGLIPIRVIHNDTKLNNLLFDIDTDEPVCVIDLDTIMPGTLLFDYGVAIRSGCNTAAEDEQNLDKVHFNFEFFKAFTKGYVNSLKGIITQKELDYLSFAARNITYECGIRFLTDFLNGDTYFKTSYDIHNLVRTRTQFKLVKEMEEQKHEMKNFINSL